MCYIPLITILGHFRPKVHIFRPHLATVTIYMHGDDETVSQSLVIFDSYLVHMTLFSFLRCYIHIFTICVILDPKMHILVPYWSLCVILLSINEVKVSHLLVWVNSYVVYIIFLVVLMCYVPILTFLRTFGPKKHLFGPKPYTNIANNIILVDNILKYIFR